VISSLSVPSIPPNLLPPVAVVRVSLDPPDDIFQNGFESGDVFNRRGR